MMISNPLFWCLNNASSCFFDHNMSSLLTTAAFWQPPSHPPFASWCIKISILVTACPRVNSKRIPVLTFNDPRCKAHHWFTKEQKLWVTPPSLCSMHPQPLDAQNYFGLRHKQAVKSLWEKKDAECLKCKTKHKAYFLSELCIANEEKRLWHFGSLAEAHVAKQFVWRGHTPAHTWVAHSHNST